MGALRIVPDTNILISCLLFSTEATDWLRHAWQSETVVPLASRETTEELLLVLAYPKFKLGDADREDILGEYLPWCETVTVPDNMAIPDCRDPDDRPFLELAMAAGADALVTGDGDLLALADSFRIPILSLTEFKKQIR